MAGIPVLLLANKLDNEVDRQVADVEVAEVARLLNVYEWDQVSVKQDTHIYSVFKELVRGIVQNLRSGWETRNFDQQSSPIFEKPICAEDLGYAGVGNSIIFGVELEEVDKTPDGLPIVIEDILKYLVRHAPNVMNVFQIPGSDRERQRLRKSADDHGHLSELNYYNDVHVVGELLKDYLRELPEPVIPMEFNAAILQAINENDTQFDLAVALVDILRSFPEDNIILLQAVFEVLYVVSGNERVNSMSTAHLASIFAPLMMRIHGLGVSKDDQYLLAQQSITCVQFLIDNTPDIFAEVEASEVEEYDEEMIGVAPGGGGMASSRGKHNPPTNSLNFLSGRSVGDAYQLPTSGRRPAHNTLNEGLL